MAVAARVKAAESDPVVIRYNDVDEVYARTRETRLLGFVFFLLSDVVLFSMFIFAYVYLRNSVPDWPPINSQGHQLPRFDTSFAAVNSVVLFGSGATMHFALESWKHMKTRAFNGWLAARSCWG
jgi:heme/copper-type cytochrome/quinol oxidase subunit 3